MTTVSVIHPGELGPGDIARWRALQAATPGLGNPFLSPEFTVAVGRHRPKARVAVLCDGPTMVGFFPFENRGPGWAVPIGAGYNDCQGLVHAPGLDWDPGELLRACGLAVWEFDHLVDGQTPFRQCRRTQSASPIMDLSAGFDPFVEQLRRGPNRLNDIARKRRKLAREAGELRFEFAEPDHRMLLRVLEWKSQQYRRTGQSDRFARGWMVELLEELVATRTAGFSGVLSMLYAGEVAVAGHFGLRANGVLAHWFPAYDAGFAGYSPGLTMHLELAGAAARAAIDHIDMGTGAEGYKRWFRSRDLVVAAGRVVSGRPGAALHWVRRTPIERLDRAITGRPALHRTAKRVRAGYQRVDVLVRRAGAARPPPG